MIEIQEQAPPIVVNVRTGDVQTIYVIQADILYKILSAGMRKFAGAPEKPESRQLAAVLRMGIKGLLLAYGHALLKMILGEGHPKPGKKDDLLDWYADIFCKIGVALAVQNVATLEGECSQNVVKVTSVSSQPNPDFP